MYLNKEHEVYIREVGAAYKWLKESIPYMENKDAIAHYQKCLGLLKTIARGYPVGKANIDLLVPGRVFAKYPQYAYAIKEAEAHNYAFVLKRLIAVFEERHGAERLAIGEKAREVQAGVKGAWEELTAILGRKSNYGAIIKALLKVYDAPSITKADMAFLSACRLDLDKSFTHDQVIAIISDYATLEESLVLFRHATEAASSGPAACGAGR